LNKAKPNTENVRGLNLVAVRRMTSKVTKLPLYPKLLFTWHNLLYQAWTERGLVYTLYIHKYSYIIK
jgi:hypothetical protein